MGIVNVTPDSFYAGSRARGREAVAAALKMCDEGADIVDVGGQSTRPGTMPISPQEELRRVAPVIEGLAGRIGCKLSVDTYNYGVAKYAADSGVEIINDITGMRSKAMRELVSDNRLECVIMHMQGSPESMQDSPHYKNVVLEVMSFLRKRTRLCEKEGIPKSRIIVDPGIGFGKTLEHNLEILRQIEKFKSLDGRLLVGASRKSFIGKICGRPGRPLPAGERLEGSLAVACYCAAKGADMVRVHDVRETRMALRMAEMLQW